MLYSSTPPRSVIVARLPMGTVAGVGSVVLRYQVVVPGSYIRKSDAAFTAAASWTAALDSAGEGGAGALDNALRARLNQARVEAPALREA